MCEATTCKNQIYSKNELIYEVSRRAEHEFLLLVSAQLKFKSRTWRLMGHTVDASIINGQAHWAFPKFNVFYAALDGSMLKRQLNMATIEPVSNSDKLNSIRVEKKNSALNSSSNRIDILI